MLASSLYFYLVMEKINKPKRFTKKKLILIIALVVIILGGGGAAAYYVFFADWIGNKNGDSSDQNADGIPTQDLMTLIDMDDGLSQFSQLLTVSGVNFTLQTPGTSYLVLAPNNYGYESLPDGYFDSLLTTAKQAIAQNIVKYHIALLPATDLIDGQKLATLAGQDVIVHLQDGQYSFTDAKGNIAEVIDTVRATNGTVYILNSIYCPNNCDYRLNMC